MARVVESVAREYGNTLEWEKVVTKDRKGAKRYEKLSRLLGRPAPVPSIFVEGQLAFEKIPSQRKLRTYIERLIANTGD